MSKDKLVNNKKIIRFLFWGAFIISVLLIILVKLTPFKDLPEPSWFNYGNEALEIIFNLSIGYIVSAIFYLIVVYYPDKEKKCKVEKAAMADLECVCIDAIMLVVLMYKNVCSKAEWNFSNLKDDAQFFNDRFYQRMKVFDAYKNADTLISKIEEDGTYSALSWDNKLEMDLKSFVDRIDQIITRYIYFLDDEIIDKVLEFRNNKLIISYLGLPSNKIITMYKGNNGLKYAERISINMFRHDPSGKKNLLFDNDMVDNGEVLHDYINTLLVFRKLCCKKTDFKKDIAIEYLYHKDCGQYGIAISDKES